MKIFIPTSTFESNDRSLVLKELLFVPYEEMSVREQTWMDYAFETGDIYVADYVELVDGTQVFSTDMGSPDSVVELRVPKYVDKMKAVRVLANAIEQLMEI